jgi:peptidoglycan/LPS O-acetylase OafA/YrhL
MTTMRVDRVKAAFPNRPASLSVESRNLDLLRAVAVLLVYGSHLLIVLPIETPGVLEHVGRAGVMLFFVHTCLVLLMSLERTALKGWTLAAHFYVRRGFRIYPLSVLVVCCVVAFRIPWMPAAPYTPVSTSGFVANVALVQNLFGVREVLGPLWSLPWEVQMYVAMPVVFAIVGRVRWAGIAWGLWAATLIVRIFGMAAHVRALGPDCLWALLPGGRDCVARYPEWRPAASERLAVALGDSRGDPHLHDGDDNGS